jgi:hypothetical protein
MKEAKLTLPYDRFYNEGTLLNSFLSKYLDPNCKNMVSPHVSINKAPFACKACCQFYCYECIKNPKNPFKSCLKCHKTLMTVAVSGSGLDELLNFSVYCKNKQFGCDKRYLLKDEQTHLQFCRYIRDEEEEEEEEGSDNDLSDLEESKDDKQPDKLRFIARTRPDAKSKPEEFICSNKHYLKLYTMKSTSPVMTLKCSHCKVEKETTLIEGDLNCIKCKEYICTDCSTLYHKLDTIITCNAEHVLIKQIVNIPGKTYVECLECADKFSIIGTVLNMLGCIECKVYICEKCQKHVLRETTIGDVKIKKVCKNPLITTQESMIAPLTCQQTTCSAALTKKFKRAEAFQDYRCNVCHKRHLDAAAGFLQCQRNHEYLVCPKCEEVLLAKTKDKKKEACPTCKIKKYLSFFQCSSNHLMALHPEKVTTICTLNCTAKNKEAVIGCQCGFGMCRTCCDYLTTVNNVQNPHFKAVKCGRGLHQLHTWVMYSTGYSCDACGKSIKVNEDTLRCRICDFDICNSCSTTYGLNPFQNVPCCGSNKLALKYTRYGYDCDFCHKSIAISIPFYTHACVSKICEPCVLNYIVKFLPPKALCKEFFFNISVRCEERHILVKLPNTEEFRTYAAINDPLKKFPCSKCKNPRNELEQWFYRCSKCNYDVCFTCAAKAIVEENPYFVSLQENIDCTPEILKELLDQGDVETLTQRMVERCETNSENLLFYKENQKVCDELLHTLVSNKVEIHKRAIETAAEEAARLKDEEEKVRIREAELLLEAEKLKNPVVIPEVVLQIEVPKPTYDDFAENIPDENAVIPNFPHETVSISPRKFPSTSSSVVKFFKPEKKEAPETEQFLNISQEGDVQP